MTKEKKCVFDFNAEELIRFKDLRLVKVNSAYYNLIEKERQLKNVENNLYLKTEFQKKGLTNDKMRNAFVSNETSKLRFEVDQLKYELKQQENIIVIINDLLALRMQEVKNE